VKNYTGLAIILLAIVVLILGIPFSLNQYAQYNDRQAALAITTAIPIPELLPNENIFGKSWCRNEGPFMHCYRFYPNHSYEYGFDGGLNDGHAQVLMPGQWNQTSHNQYEILDPHQTFTYLDGRIFTNLNPSSGSCELNEYGLVRLRG
jgi:hypothetical protein